LGLRTERRRRGDRHRSDCPAPNWAALIASNECLLRSLPSGGAREQRRCAQRTSQAGAHSHRVHIRRSGCPRRMSTPRTGRTRIESWRRHYNSVRPHASLATSHRLRVFVPAFAAWPRAAAPPRRDFPRPGQCEWGARGLVRWPPAERAARLALAPCHLAYVLDPGSSGRAKLTQVS
jgi:hypothetical protein